MFKHIVISGAGMRCVTLLGSIMYLCEHYKLHETVMTCVGSSAGAMLCMMICCGLQPIRMKQIMFEGITALSNRPVNIDNLFNIYHTMAIDDGKLIKQLIQKVIQERFHSSDITFLDFAKLTGKNLVVCVSNLTKTKVEYWNVDSQPNMSIVKALQASTAIPVIFPPVSHEDCVYADGCIFNHFPIQYFDHKAIHLRDTIGILVDPFDEKTDDSLNLLSYMTLLIRSVIEKINHESMHDMEKNNVIINICQLKDVDVSFDYKQLKFVMTPEQFKLLLNHGYAQTESHLHSALATSVTGDK